VVVEVILIIVTHLHRLVDLAVEEYLPKKVAEDLSFLVELELLVKEMTEETVQAVEVTDQEDLVAELLRLEETEFKTVLLILEETVKLQLSQVLQ
jgi:hypothetical protein